MCLLRAFKTGQSSKLFLVEIPQVMDLYEMKWILQQHAPSVQQQWFKKMEI